MGIGLRLAGAIAAVAVPAVCVAGFDDILVFETGDPVSADGINQNFETLRSANETLQQQLEALVIRQAKEIQVADCRALQDQLGWLSQVSIVAPAKVTLVIAKGEHVCERIAPRLPFGYSVEIQGGGQGPAETVLQFEGAGVSVSGPYGLRLKNLRLIGANGDNGVIASSGAEVTLTSVELVGFEYGARAYSNGHVVAEESTAEGNSRSGFLADHMGVMELWGCTSKENGGSGFVAATLSRVIVRPSGETLTTAVGNGGFGFVADTGGILRAWDQELSGEGNSELTNVPVVGGMLQGN